MANVTASSETLGRERGERREREGGGGGGGEGGRRGGRAGERVMEGEKSEEY